MGKGILLEMGGREAVVLTPQGAFKKVPVPKGTWEIGDEIDFAETPQQSYWAKWGLAAAAAAILLLAPLGYAGFQQYQLALPAAIVTLDINPSLELTLNKVDDVLSARGLNADGAALLAHIDTKGRPPLDTVVQAATQAAVDMQKLDPADASSAVLLAVVPVDNEQLPVARAEAIREKAKAAAAGQVSQAAKRQGVQPQTSVAGVVASPAEKQAAEQAGISPGKYVFYEELQQVAPQVQLEDVKNSGPGKLMKSLNISPSELFGQAEEKHGADDQNKGKAKQNGPQQAGPVNGKTENNQPGNGKSEHPGQSEDPKQGQKQEDKGNAPAEPKQEQKGSETPHEKQNGNGHGNGNGVQQQNNTGKGSSGAQDEQKNESGNKGDQKKQDPPSQKENGNDKKSTWTIPFLGITIEKPAFLQGKDETPAAPAAPVVATPRAAEPGAGAPADKQPEQKQPEQKQPEQKQPEQKQPEQKQPEQKRPEQKQPEQKQSDTKKSENGSGTGQDKGNRDSGKSHGKKSVD